MFVPLLTLAAVSLVPAPQSLVELGGTTTNRSVSFVRDASLPAEGYRLKVTDAGAVLAHADEAGRLYAQVTLDQLRDAEGNVAKVEIEDAPAFPWRGWLIDSCRHFLPKENMLDVLDIMVLHKLNVLHWHLTEDEAWRIPIRKYPELVKYGAACSYHARDRRNRWHRVRDWIAGGDAQKYGPYWYTREDIAEVRAAARARNIRIVPEFDVPGHSRALLVALPELACDEALFATNRVPNDGGHPSSASLCLGNDHTLEVVLDILDEVCELFPESDTIHIGGDECSTKWWETCPKCQARMKAEGLKKERELQTWFTKKIVAHLAAKGRKAVGWAEIVRDPGVPAEHAIPMAWLYDDEGQRQLGNYSPRFSELTDRGYDIVAGSHRHAYWGQPHCRDDEYDPQPKKGYYFPISLPDVYDLDLDVGQPGPGKGRVLGTEGYTWGEECWNFFDYMYRSFPRMCAIAEIVWRNPVPKDYGDFYRRMQDHAKRLRAMRIPCAPVDPPEAKRGY